MLGPDEVVDVIKRGVDNVPIEMQMMYGIIPLAVLQIFQSINDLLEKDPSATFEIKCQYLEIYNEKVNDLLSEPPKQNLKLRELKNGNITILNCEPCLVSTPEEIFDLLKLGQMNRAVAGTNQNARSS